MVALFRQFRVGLLLFLCVLAAAAQEKPKPNDGNRSGAAPVIAGQALLEIPRVAQPPRIEDYLHPKPGVPPPGKRVEDFRQREPGDGTPASEPTIAYLSYDNKSLYAIFICKDEPGEVRAHMAKREDIGQDDNVAIMLDTFHDRRRSYLFAVNPLGIQLDAILTEGQADDVSFDTLWYSEGRLIADGYIVRIEIPFKSLRFPSAPAQEWGIAVGRYIVRKNETSHWPLITRRIEGFTNQYATLRGLENISPGRNLQFIPYGIFSRSRFLDQAAAGGPDFRTKNDGRAGLDAKLVLHDAVTMDVALNPDFSQVESDEPQVTINQRFEVFFPEKRPFFIENAGFFRTPLNLFFSRRIADPQFGVRVTGKAGPWTFGGIGIDDRHAGRAAECSPADTSRAGIGVLRVQREFGPQSTIGFFASSRDFPSCSNRVFSLDTRIKLNPNWIFTGQIIRSYTRRQDGSRFAGPAYWADISHVGRHFIYTGRYEDRSPNFRTHLGFVPRVDIRQSEQYASYTWRPNGRRLLSFGPNVFNVVNWDRQGRVQDWFVNLQFALELPRQTYFYATRYEAFTLFQNLGFRHHSTGLSLSTEWKKWLAFNSSFSHGSDINYFPGSAMLPFLGNSTSGQVGFTLRPQPRLRLEETYTYSRLASRAGSTPAGFAPDTPIFNNHIVRSKLNYQFTRELSVRAILDYNAVLPNSQLVALNRTKSLKGDLLLTYLVNPGTALYVGYSDLYENLDIDPISMAPLRTLRLTNSPTTPTGRQFFVKLSYLFRF